MSAPETNVWTAVTTQNPDHSANYAQRWRTFEKAGKDIYGEARLVDALVERGSRILDAGCGSGRVGGYLSRRGHTVVGVDLDPYLIEVAAADHPMAQWVQGDLATFQLQTEAGLAQFDHIVSAGNVMTFLAGYERVPALRQMKAHLAADGRMTIGFGAGRNYDFAEFEADALDAGLVLEARYSTWQLHPANDSFLVAMLTHA
ncbi:class I SAM-dependent methyltransferase [Flaviflexus equikiangi]|uniref:Class I SAM-dependent methyltransferase n=1 Tax=Flaviflexus equikiangi TaxID=2758573 RepID=A0ABS2TEV6_9ACTO|nr:class I SAM-dependent methyltransferase [Flaviflexus equikiangi]MBM9433190.1 class I SAM-dependent methyltransferase [Flaviflexus equikiangi]